MHRTGHVAVVSAGALAAVLLSGARVQAPPAPVELFFEAPAGSRPTRIVPGEETVLPNGRLLTPRGIQHYTAPHPMGLALSPDGRTLVTVNSGTRPFSLTVLRLGRDARTIQLPLHATFMGVAIAPDNRTAFVSGGNDGTVLVYDLARGKRQGEIRLERDSYTGEMALDPAGRYLYVCDQAYFRVAVIDARARQVIGGARVGRLPFGIAVAPDGREVYVAHVGMFEYSLLPGGLSFPPYGFPSREAREGTVAEGKRVPGLGDPNVPESFSVWALDVADPARPEITARIKTGLPAGELSFGGSSPNSLAVGPHRLYVSNATNDTVAVIDRRTRQVLKDIPLGPAPVARLRGNIPFGLALAPDGRRLYVAEAGINAVAVIATDSDRVLGHIPVGWYPSKLAVSSDGRTLYVANAKGMGSGPNFPARPEGTYVGDISRGTVSVIPLPGDEELPRETEQVLRNNGFIAQPAPPLPAAFRAIRHVVYIIKENRTYDEVFGDLPGGDGRKGLARYGERVTPNHHALARRFAASDNFYVDSDVSADGHRWAVGNYPNEWVESSWPASYGRQRDFRPNPQAPGRLAVAGSNSSVHPEDYLEAGSLWEHLARHGIAFRNFGEGFEFAFPFSNPRATRILALDANIHAGSSVNTAIRR